MNLDLPISNSKEDIIGRAKLANEITELIGKYANVESVVMGIYGEWGSGKTSLLNLIVETINKKYTEIDLEKPLIIRFNPWNYSNQNQLLSQFFRKLKYELNLKDNSERIKRVGEIFENISNFFESYPIIGPVMFPFITLGKLLKSYGNTRSLDLDSAKNEINLYLEKLPYKFIIIIDDIDRLNKDEIRQIFQLVKQLGDFKNTLYILSFDRKIVSEALQHFQGIDGDKYLEKIIQIPISMPNIDEVIKEEILFEKLDNLISLNNVDDFDNYYWGNLYHCYIKYLFSNLRDVKRYINALLVNYNLIKNEVNIPDFFAITAMQVFNNKVYLEIKNNKDLFIRNKKVEFVKEIRSNLKEDSGRRLEKIINYVPNELKYRFKEFLERLFPTIKYEDSSYSENHAWTENKRICSSEKFDLYFTLDINKYALSNEEFFRFLHLSGHRIDFARALLAFKKSKKIYKLLELLENHVLKNKNIENYDIILESLIEIADVLCVDDSNYFNKGISSLIFSIIYKILFNIKDDTERLELIKKSIEKSDNGLYMSVDLVNYLTIEYGKYDSKNTADVEKKLVGFDDLEILEQLAISKIVKEVDSGSFFQRYQIPYILYRWERWEKDNECIKKNILNYIKTDQGLLNFICKFLQRVSNTDISDYVFKLSYDLFYKDLQHFLNVDEIANRIYKLSTSEQFNELSILEKEAIKLFIEYYENKVTRI